jgi:cell division protein FtsA
MRKTNSNAGKIVALDVGTTKICVVTAERTASGIGIVSARTFPSVGLRKGVIIDNEAAADSIRRALDESVPRKNQTVSVCVGIAGSHIKAISSEGAVSLTGKKVSSRDVEIAIDAASAAYVPLDREILHILPTDFILDGKGGIKDPVGLSGRRLEVKVTIVTGAIAAVQSLIRACEQAAVSVSDIVLQPIASAEATLTPRERDRGVALIDIGGGTTDIAIYQNGWLVRTAVLGIGGNHFTNDLAIGLGVSFLEAERIKKLFGSVLRDARQEQRPIKVALANGHVKTIAAGDVTNILEPRAEEIIELIKKELNEAEKQGVQFSRVVLTGGSSLLTGLEQFAGGRLALPVRIGYPEVGTAETSHLSDRSTSTVKGGTAPIEFSNPIYATGIGLLLYAAQTEEAARGSLQDSPHLFQQLMDTMTGWFQNFSKSLGKSRRKKDV